MSIGSPNWQTMAFTSLTMCQMFVVLAIRSDREGLHTIGVFSNRHLIGAVLLTFLLQLAVIYIPALNPIFKTTPLTARSWRSRFSCRRSCWWWSSSRRCHPPRRAVRGAPRRERPGMEVGRDRARRMSC